jgi:hypothetical protein
VSRELVPGDMFDEVNRAKIVMALRRRSMIFCVGCPTS